MKICTLLEALKIYRIDKNAKSVIINLEKAMKKLAEKYSKHETTSSSHPAAPDSSKFRATVSGMINVEHDVHVHGGHYGIPKTYNVFLKIGGGVKSTIKKELSDEMIKIVSKMVDDSSGLKIPVSLWCDDMSISMTEESGTNWGGVGFTLRKYSESEEKQLDKYDLGD